MVLTPKQEQIASDTTRFRVLACGRGFGKTTYSLEEAIGVAIAKKRRRVAYIATTIQQARDVAWDKLTDRVKPITKSTNKSLLEVEVMTQDKGTSKIVLRGWEAIETLRGQEFDFLILDEVAFMRGFWYGWESVLRPTLRMSEGGALFISTPQGFNHFYDLYNLQIKDSQFKSFHATSYDNPHISREEIESARKTLPEDTFAQEYLADFRKQEGLVYKEFNRELHVSENPDFLNGEKLGGIDFGFTNPTAIVTIYRNGDFYYVADEFYERGKTEEQVADFVYKQRFSKVYPDPENPSAIQTLKNKMINVMEVVKGKDSIKSGIDKVRTLLKSNKIIINPSCLNLIAEMEMYHYEEKKRNSVDEPENPKKEFDHLLDSLRYVIMSQEDNSYIPFMQSRVFQNRERPRGFK